MIMDNGCQKSDNIIINNLNWLDHKPSLLRCIAILIIKITNIAVLSTYIKKMNSQQTLKTIVSLTWTNK